ncbi:2178_t:CDS:2 [Diversispora eburnea]|uniref:2178_t:CDS:1 n=1 Tax=Diversispora eburnea TaxID=1213867 RepID=A0A9N9BSP9_9GLOM|nr:2178_t:CDS:2 [Diversispora eburnea]
MTTHIVGHCKTVDTINNYIVNFLPLQNENFAPLISYSIDHMNGQEWKSDDDEKLFRRYINFPSIITLVLGTKVITT